MNNKELLEEVYLSQRPILLRFCRGIIRSRADAEDIVQAVFIKAWNYPLGFSDAEHCFRFLRRSCRNACIDLIRRGKAWKRAEARLERETLANMLIGKTTRVILVVLFTC